MISGLVTAALLAAFFGIVYWAYTPRNRSRWQQMAQIPLLDDETAPRPKSGVNGAGESQP